MLSHMFLWLTVVIENWCWFRQNVCRFLKILTRKNYVYLFFCFIFGRFGRFPKDPAEKVSFLLLGNEFDLRLTGILTPTATLCSLPFSHYLFTQVLSAAGSTVRLGLLALKHRITCFNMFTRQSDWPVRFIYVPSLGHLEQRLLVLGSSWTFRWRSLLYPKATKKAHYYEKCSIAMLSFSWDSLVVCSVNKDHCL